MKVLGMNCYFRLSDDFEGDLNDALKEVIKYRIEKGYKDLNNIKNQDPLIKDELWSSFYKEQRKGYKLIGNIALQKYTGEKWINLLSIPEKITFIPCLLVRLVYSMELIAKNTWSYIKKFFSILGGDYSKLLKIKRSYITEKDIYEIYPKRNKFHIKLALMFAVENCNLQKLGNRFYDPDLIKVNWKGIVWGKGNLLFRAYNTI